MRRLIIAGNWKMNKTVDESVTLINGLKATIGSVTEIDMVVIPPYVNCESVKKTIDGTQIKLGAQNCYFKDSGAFTGEISVPMLKAVGCDYIVVGHSERRQFFGETNESVNLKLKSVFDHDCIPIMCIGETLQEREANQTFLIIETQLREGLKGLEPLLVELQKPFVVAYEPVWAIGTGKVATPDQAQEVHAFIRDKLTSLLTKPIADQTQIQYGGSVKPDNVKLLMQQNDIDGALVGGASLTVDSFSQLIHLSLS